MNKKIIFILIIAAFVAAAVFCPAVSARYTADGQESKGIDSGDLVFPERKTWTSRNLNGMDTQQTHSCQMTKVL